MKILIVGQNPSSKNFSRKVPFVGTRSGTTLDQWIDILGIKKYELINASNEIWTTNYKTSKVLKKIDHKKYDKIIALGRIAEIALTKSGCTNYYKLPHPSGKNRMLNDKFKVLLALDKCIDYLFEK